MFKNSNDISIKFLFLVLLLIPLQIVSFEITFTILLISTVFLLNKRNQKISGDFITVILFLLVIFSIGILLTFFYKYNYVDIGKDIAYFLKPILLLFLGYAIIHTIIDTAYFFKAFVYIGIAFAISHLFKVVNYTDLFSTNINNLRNATGLSNHVELLALIFLLLSFKYPKIQIFKHKKTTYTALIILSISFLLYFSRAMWVAVFIFLLTAFGYAKISLKALKYLGITIVLLGSLYIYLYSIDIQRNKSGISTFLYKIKIAPEEIFKPKIDLNDHAALWDHWRAYEAKMAFDQMHSSQHIFGKGFGSLVDLHFVAPLNEEGMQFISLLHNGYAMVYYKSGIIGLMFYFLFLLNLYLYTFYTKNKKRDIPINNLIAAIGIYLFFSTLIIAGVYNLNEIYLFALGGLLALYDKNKNYKLDTK